MLGWEWKVPILNMGRKRNFSSQGKLEGNGETEFSNGKKEKGTETVFGHRIDDKGRKRGVQRCCIVLTGVR